MNCLEQSVINKVLSGYSDSQSRSGYTDSEVKELLVMGVQGFDRKVRNANNVGLSVKDVGLLGNMNVISEN